MARARTKKIDNVFWGSSGAGFLAVGAGSDAGFNAIGVGTQAATLLRVRGSFRAWLDGVQDPGVSIVLVQAGLILVPEGSGVTVQYSPASDSNAPWLYYTSGIISYEESVANVIAISGLDMFEDRIDNKAMRRIRPDVEVQFVVSNTAIQGTAAINAAFGVRILQGF